jgi:hypothetical protein
MKRVLLCIWLAGCAAPKEARTVATIEAPLGLQRRTEIDTVRVSHGAATGQWSVAGLVEKHLAGFGLVRPGKSQEDTIVVLAELPTPGYALEARIQPRPEQFCHVELAVIDAGTGRAVDTAPWWAIYALDESQRGIDTLTPPRRPPLDDTQFARLHAEALALAKSGEDRLLTFDEYLHAPRPLDLGGHYYAPRESQLRPEKP